jgi:hypothetical protein
MGIRLEKLPQLKQKIESDLNDLMSLAEKPIETINWQVSVDIGNRKINIEIEPCYSELPDENKFGITGEKGSDIITPIQPEFSTRNPLTEDQ